MLQPHPLSLITPPLTKEEEDALEESLLLNGQIEDITTLDGMILNGNHRYKLLIKNGITPRVKEFHSNGCASAEDFVIAMLQGRNLTQGQKACVLALKNNEIKLTHSSQGKADHKKDPNNTVWENRRINRTYVKLAKEIGVGPTYATQAIALFNNSKKYFKLAFSGEMTLNEAYNKHRKETGSNLRGPRDSTIWNANSLGSVIKIPNCFDSREDIDNFIKIMNNNGWMLEVRFKGGKIYANWFGNGFHANRHWEGEIGEFEFRRAVVVAANDKRKNILKLNNKKL